MQSRLDHILTISPFHTQCDARCAVWLLATVPESIHDRACPPVRLQGRSWQDTDPGRGRRSDAFCGAFAVDDISAMKEMWFTNNRKPEFNVVFRQEAIFPEGKPELFAAALMAVAQLAVKDFDDSVTKRWPDRNNNMTLKFP